MKIAIGSDHAGYNYKSHLIEWMKEQGHEILDCGTHTPETCDYPLFVIPAAESVMQGKADRAIVIGGSGNGEAIAANKVRGVRCALCWNTETAELSRRHNDSNVLSLGERMVSFEIALDILKIWLSTPFEGGRHIKRLAAVTDYDNSRP